MSFTRTITIARDEQPPLVPRQAMPGQGTALGGPAGGEGNMPPGREGVIRTRLERMIAAGRELKIQDLIRRLREAGLGAGWIVEFEAMDLDDTEGRALNLAVLVIQVIRPEALRNRSLLQLEDLCREILQQMIAGGETVEQFLVSCEIGLREHSLLHRQAAVVNRVVRERMERAAETIAFQLREFNNGRRTMDQAVIQQLTGLAGQVEQLRRNLIDRAREIGELPQAEGVLEECERLCEELMRIK